MVRSVGIVAVIVGLAWTGLAGAQSSSPLEKARYINVTEEGKPPQRCKLLKTWRETNGAAVFQVQAVDTGEMMTIVGTAPQGAGGDAREMTTRIFRWGSANKPPAGAPVPPRTATASTTPPQQPTAVQKPRIITPQASRPAPVAAATRFAPPATTVQKSSPATAPTQTQPTTMPNTLTSSQPASSAGSRLIPASTTVQQPTPSPDTKQMQPTITRTAVTNSKPASPAVAAKPVPAITTKTQPLTPMGTQVIQYSPASPGNKLPDVPATTNSQPRLMPLAAGSAANPKSCNCACPQPCDSCCKPCNPCCQSPCVCNPPSPMRQPLIGRLLKSNNSCSCTTVVSQPLPKPAATPVSASTVVKATTEPTQPGDWRQSWGNVEPGKGSAQTTTVKPLEVSSRADPKPVPMEPSTQPDPLNNPDQYRDMVMNSRLANSKIPQQPQPAVHPGQEAAMMNAPPKEGLQPDGTVVVSSDAPNAFWAPKSPAAGQVKEKINAFDRLPDPPPQSAPPAFAGAPSYGRRPLPDIPGVAIPMLPPNAPAMTMPTPPLPSTAVPRGPVAMIPDAGVPNALGNAFTLPATSRPIPADFGGTPQEPNGFNPLSRTGQGAPPQAYGMGMPAGYRPQMSNMMAMGPQGQMGVNPLMSVPPTYPNGQPVATVGESAQPSGVPQLLAALKDSLRPSERETAAEQLSELNWRMQPLVVQSLMKSAREDPAATVRAACVHALAHMKVDAPAAVALVRELRSDRDAIVRQEAEEALHTLGDSGIQQASHK